MRPILKRLLVLLVPALSACGGDDEWTLRMSFAATPAVMTSGGWVTLIWSSDDASSCTADDGWRGAKAVSGSERILLDGSGRRTFKLSCSDGDRSVVNTVEVSVAPS